MRDLVSIVMEMWPFKRFRIVGESMSPAYKDGDIVLIYRWGKIRAGDVVVFRKEGMTMIKRAISKTNDGWNVRGDNISNSTDSLEFGTVPFGRIEGSVIARY